MNSENMDEKKKTGKILFELGLLILIGTLLSYFGIQQCISHGWKVSMGGELFSKAFIQTDGSYVLTYLTQESIYLSFLSVLFSFLGNKEELVLVINLILQLVGILFFYLGAKKISSITFSVIVAVIGGLLSGYYYAVTMDCPMHIIWCLFGILFWMLTKIYCDCRGKFLKYLFIGIVLGISCYVDMAAFFLFLVFIIFILVDGCFSFKEKLVQLFWCLITVVSSFIVMFYLWNNYLFNVSLFYKWLEERLYYFTKATHFNHYVSLGIISIFSVIFYAINRPENNVEIIGNTENIKNTEDIGNVATVVDATDMTESVSEVPAETVIEDSKPIKFIENPLPLPKKHVKKEMNYAFEPTPDQMHYDLNNYDVDDDYDLKEI